MAAKLSLGWHFVVAGTIAELSFTWLWSPGAASAAQRVLKQCLGKIPLDVCSGICLLWDKLDGKLNFLKGWIL